MKIYTFRVIIEPDEKNTFHGYVPALSGCHTWGESLEETKKNLKDAIKCYVESLKADKKPIPEEIGLEFFESISEKELKPVKNSAAYA